VSSLRLTRAILLPALPDRSAVAEPVRPTVHARGPSPAVRRYRGRMPSGIPPDEPEETPPGTDHSSGGEPGSASAAPGGKADGTGEVPVHPDDRLWRHPSELARMRAAERTAGLQPTPAPTPGSARQGATSPRVSRIPTSAVIAAGVAAVIASVGGLIALASGGTADADDGPTPTLGGETAAESQPSIVAGSRRATGVMVDAAGVAIVAMDDPPEQATLIADGRRAPVTLRSADRRLALAAYQVDAADDPDGAATVGPTTLAATGQARESGDWALPTGTPDMNGLTSEWVPSDWGRILVADLGQRNVPPGTELTDRGRLLGLTTRTSDDRTMAVPWPVLRSLGARLRPQPLPAGDLPAQLSDDGDHPTVAKAWGDGTLRERDQVVAVGGHPVVSGDEAQAVAAFYLEGDTVKVRCQRSGRAITVAVKLE
jgi:S1-C subfamily serine protease